MTPPIFMRSSMARSQAPAAIALAMPRGNHQFSPVWTGTGATPVRTRRWPCRSSAGTGSSTQARSNSASRAMRARRLLTVSDWL